MAVEHGKNCAGCVGGRRAWWVEERGAYEEGARGRGGGKCAGVMSGVQCVFRNGAIRWIRFLCYLVTKETTFGGANSKHLKDVMI